MPEQCERSSGVVSRLRAAGCVFAEDEARLLLQAATSDNLEQLVRRRVAGEPLEQVLGWVDFCGHRVAVEPGVFVPRQRTEFLATNARSVAPAGSLVVDLCTGVGAVALAVAVATPLGELHASDVDPAAVRCARRNLAPVSGQVHTGDLFEPLPRQLRGRVDVITANAPYVPTTEIALMPPEARDHEPSVALDGGNDGLDFHRRIASEAAHWLAPAGVLLLETSRRQAATTARILRDSGLQPHVLRDEAIDATVVLARRESSAAPSRSRAT